MGPTETTLGEIARRLTELATEEIERCSCDESLALRAQLALATRGSVAVHVIKDDGYWTIERYRHGELVESYVGVVTLAEAMDRISDWLRT